VFIAGVVDTGVVDSGEKFITGIVVTGYHCTLVSLVPAINLSPVAFTGDNCSAVSTTPVNKRYSGARGTLILEKN
jgi:hypothetical protein